MIRPGLNRDLSSSFDIDPRAARQGVTGGIGNISLDGPGSGSGGGFKRKNIGGAGIGLGGGLGDTSTEGEGGSASGRKFMPISSHLSNPLLFKETADAD